MPTQPPALTLLEAVEAPELHQAVAIVVVGDVDSVILGCWVLHPGPLVAPIAMVLYGGLHRLDGAFTLHLFHWVPRRRRKAYPMPSAWPRLPDHHVGSLSQSPAHSPLFGVSGPPLLSAPCPRTVAGGLRAAVRGARVVLGAAVVLGMVVSACAMAWAGVPSAGGSFSSCCSTTAIPLAGLSMGDEPGGQCIVGQTLALCLGGRVPPAPWCSPRLPAGPSAAPACLAL